MSGIGNMNIIDLLPNQDQPEVTVNDSVGRLANKATTEFGIAIDASNIATLTLDQQANASLFVIADGSPGSTGPFVVNFQPFGMGLFRVKNATGFLATLTIAGQPAIAPTLAHGATGLFDNNGVNVERIV